MRRILPVILSFALLFLLSACTASESPDTTPEPAPSWIILPETEG